MKRNDNLLTRPSNVTVVHVDADCGRTTSKRPKQTNDCTVRALAAAFDLDYDYAYDLLKTSGRVCSRGFNLMKWMESNWHNGLLLGRAVKKISFPAVKGQPRMNVATFAKTFAEGTYIVRVSKHVACIKNGVYLDWLNGGQYGYKCVYLAYQIENL